jgi:hypothetical protein
MFTASDFGMCRQKRITSAKRKATHMIVSVLLDFTTASSVRSTNIGEEKKKLKISDITTEIQTYQKNWQPHTAVSNEHKISNPERGHITLQISYCGCRKER